MRFGLFVALTLLFMLFSGPATASAPAQTLTAIGPDKPLPSTSTTGRLLSRTVETACSGRQTTPVHATTMHWVVVKTFSYNDSLYSARTIAPPGSHRFAPQAAKAASQGTRLTAWMSSV